MGTTFIACDQQGDRRTAATFGVKKMNADNLKIVKVKNYSGRGTHSYTM